MGVNGWVGCVCVSVCVHACVGVVGVGVCVDVWLWVHQWVGWLCVCVFQCACVLSWCGCARTYVRTYVHECHSHFCSWSATHGNWGTAGGCAEWALLHSHLPTEGKRREDLIRNILELHGDIVLLHTCMSYIVLFILA